MGQTAVIKSIHHTLHICESTVAWGRALGRITLLSVMHLLVDTWCDFIYIHDLK